jgi:hypothetical protein
MVECVKALAQLLQLTSQCGGMDGPGPDNMCLSVYRSFSGSNPLRSVVGTQTRFLPTFRSGGYTRGEGGAT